MEQTWETGNRSLSLDVTIKCQNKCRFRVIASDFKKNTKYADRVIEVSGYRSIYLSLPTSPEKLRIVVTAIDTNKDYIVSIKEKTLRTYDINKDAEMIQFVKFAQQFCTQCGYSDSSVKGRWFRTAD